jgi:GDPmannose 4,6-dehydratase
MWMMLQQDIPDDYVVCTGETHTIKEFLDVAFNHVKIKDWSGYVVQDPKFYRPAEVDYLRGDNSKAEEKLGWIPETSFEELVKMMVDHDLQT